MDLYSFGVGATVTTSTTVASVKITINAPARIGQRVYLIAASYTTDLAGAFDCQDSTTSVFQVKAEASSATFAQQAFTPAVPIPISSAGVAANFALNVTTTGRLSLAYTYGP